MNIIIGIIIIFCLCFLPGIITEIKFNNRAISGEYRIDWGLMNHDLVCGKSHEEVKKKYNVGKYDILK